MSGKLISLVGIVVLCVSRTPQCQLVTATPASGIVTCSGQLIGNKNVTATNHDTVQVTLLMNQAVLSSGSSCLSISATPTIVIAKGLSNNIATINLGASCAIGTYNATYQIPFCEGSVSSCSNPKSFTITASGDVRATIMVSSDADPGMSFDNVPVGVSDTIQVTLTADGDNSASTSISSVNVGGDTSVIKPVGGIAALRVTMNGGTNKTLSFIAKPKSLGKTTASFDLPFHPCNGAVGYEHANIFLDVNGVPPPPNNVITFRKGHIDKNESIMNLARFMRRGALPEGITVLNTRGQSCYGMSKYNAGIYIIRIKQQSDQFIYRKIFIQ